MRQLQGNPGRPAAVVLLGLALAVGLAWSGEAGAQTGLTPVFTALEKADAVGPASIWKLEQGTLTGETRKGERVGYLVGRESYKDFVLRGKVAADSHGAILLRSDRGGGPAAVLMNAAEVGLGNLALRAGGTKSLAKVPEPARALALSRKQGDWNVFEIRARGDQFTVSINGVPVVEAKAPDGPAEGRIGVMVKHDGHRMRVADFVVTPE